MRQITVLLASLALLAIPALGHADVLDEIGGGKRARQSHVRDHQRFVAGADRISIHYREQLNFAPLLDRLYTLLTSPEWLGGKYPECEQAIVAAREMGAFALTSTLEELRVDGTDITAHCSTYYSDLDPASARGRLLGLPNLPLVSAEYAPADSLFYFGMQHLPAYLAAAADGLRQAGGSGGPLEGLVDELGLEDAESMFAMAALMGLDKLAAESLSGEVAMVLAGLPPAGKIKEDPESLQPGDVPFALMIGLKDGAALDSVLGGFAGQAGLIPLDNAGQGWRAYNIPQAPGVTVAYNEEILIAATTPEMLARCMAAPAGVSAPDCQYHLRLNLPAIAAAASPYADLLVEEIRAKVPDGGSLFIPEKEAAFLLDLPADMAAMGNVSATGYYDQGYNVDFSMKTAAFKYAAYYLALLGCMAAQTGAFD